MKNKTAITTGILFAGFAVFWGVARREESAGVSVREQTEMAEHSTKKIEQPTPKVTGVQTNPRSPQHATSSVSTPAVKETDAAASTPATEETAREQQLSAEDPVAVEDKLSRTLASDTDFQKTFDVDQVTCTGPSCKIEVTAKPGHDNTSMTPIMDFLRKNPQFGNNFSMDVGSGSSSTFTISKEKLH